MPKPINKENQHLFAILGFAVADNWDRLEASSQEAILDTVIKVRPWSGQLAPVNVKQRIEALIEENDE